MTSQKVPSRWIQSADAAQAGSARLDFGRYQGWTLREVARGDLNYLRWLSRHASGARHREEIAILLREFEPPKPP